MIIAQKWLHRHIDFDLEANKIGDILTSLGLEVSKISSYTSFNQSLEGIVVAEIISLKNLPKKNLKVVCLDIGQGKTIEVVCGASNIALHDKVPYASIGSKINPRDTKMPIFIEEKKINGISSKGMICSGFELGINTDNKGILLLENHFETGAPLGKVLKPYCDTLFEIDLTPNRSDAFSHLGVARDLKAYFSTHSIPFIWHDVLENLPSLPEVSSEELPLSIQNPEACSYYGALCFKNISNKTSAPWLQNYLESIGLKPKNFLVDLTNFILMDIGQPLHIFEASYFKEGLWVRNAKENEKIKLLNGQEKNLDLTDLVIASKEKAHAVAGVIGGEESATQDQGDSRDFILEGAYFDVTTVRKTAKRLQIQTDASFRYERGTDPFLPEKGLRLYLQYLIKNLGPCSLLFNFKEADRCKFFQFKVDTTCINQLLGTQLSTALFQKILKNLEIKSEVYKKDVLALEVPSYRVDVKREADIAEEILRVYGTEKIAVPTHWCFEGNKVKESHSKEKITQQLVALGLQEAMTVSFLDKKNAELFTSNTKSIVEIFNPLHQEYSFLRPSLLPNLLESVKLNFNHKEKKVELFEFGKVYAKTKENYLEQWQLGLIFSEDPKAKKKWNHPKATFD